MVRISVPEEHVIGPESGDPPRLVLMDEAGEVLARPALTRPGRVDLAEAFANLWELQKTAYVQVFTDDGPLGPALVLVPLVEPPTPIIEQEIHESTGNETPRIVGWEEPEQDAFAGYRAYVEQDVLFETSQGAIQLAMRPDEAPNTVWNFMQLTRGGFYDGTAFHRIVPVTSAGDPFVIQGGDPSGTGVGGPGYAIDIEPSNLAHDYGVISMARAAQVNSAGSQYFICLSREGTARLDGQYCAFGYAVSGAATVDAIADAELEDAETGRPVDPPRVIEASLIAAPPRRVGIGRPDARIKRENAGTLDEPEEDRVPR